MAVDTHAHLDFEDFDVDRDDVIARSTASGITALINPGIDFATSRKAVSLAASYDEIFAAVGIHPNYTAEANPGDMFETAALAGQPKVVAIGEIGLDFYRDRSPVETQVRAFRGQLDLAREMDLPVIIHFRSVEEDGISLVGEDSFSGLRGVFHCFGGSLSFAKQVLSMGFYIGFDGPLTYKKSDRVDIAKEMPLERILIETDAPFLSPQKYRGKRNEPSYVLEVADALAMHTGRDVSDVFEITDKNARDLFELG